MRSRRRRPAGAPAGMKFTAYRPPRPSFTCPANRQSWIAAAESLPTVNTGRPGSVGQLVVRGHLLGAGEDGPGVVRLQRALQRIGIKADASHGLAAPGGGGRPGAVGADGAGVDCAGRDLGLVHAGLELFGRYLVGPGRLQRPGGRAGVPGQAYGRWRSSGRSRCPSGAGRARGR